LEGGNKRERVLGEGKWVLESDIGLLVIRFCNQRICVTLLLALHVKSSHLLDLETIEGF